MKRKTPLLTIAALVAIAVACGSPASINSTRAQTSEENQSDPNTSASTSTSPTTPTSTCPKCKGAMEPGVIPDYWAINSVNQSVWTKTMPKMFILAKNPPKKKIVVYRCTNCGYLESYAK